MSEPTEYSPDPQRFRHKHTMNGWVWECKACGVWHRELADSKHTGQCPNRTVKKKAKAK